MEREYIAGTTSVDGIRVGHTFHELQVLEKFVVDTRPMHFIEIGVHEGGLSYLMLPILSAITGCEYTGVEINCNLVLPRVKAMYEAYNARLLCVDCFGDDVYGYVKIRKSKILYCDGGNKALEIAHFQDALNSGDIIMCHDFYGFDRVPAEIPEYKQLCLEVVESDVQIYENCTAFERLPEDMFKETRIIGWRKL